MVDMTGHFLNPEMSSIKNFQKIKIILDKRSRERERESESVVERRPRDGIEEGRKKSS